MDTPLQRNIDISDIEPEAVDKVRAVGIVKKVGISEPNDKGNQMISIAIEYPVGSPNKQTLVASLTYNEELFRNKSGLTDGQVRYYNMNKARIKEFRLATSDEDYHVQNVKDAEGREVGFVAGPSGLDVSRYEFKSFFKA